MYKLVYLLFFAYYIVPSFVLAQGGYSISGTVSDEDLTPLKGATVFISGTEKISVTDSEGRFLFNGLSPGNYSISLKMLGYQTPSRAVTIQNKSIHLKIIPEVKTIILKEVTIETKGDREKNLVIFKTQFLGTLFSEGYCDILNPEVISFKRKPIDPSHSILKASAEELLIIENRLLGYKIRYLLREFEHNSKTLTTFYDGDSFFQDLDSTARQENVWEENRLRVYQGSLLHFLRSVFVGNVLEEGFVTNQIYKNSNLFDPQTYVNSTPVSFDSLVSRIDSAFISFKFSALNVSYDLKKASRLKRKQVRKNQANLFVVTPDRESSQLLLHLDKAIVDARGSVNTGYRTFLIRGLWAGKRIGDQLPLEYEPTGASDQGSQN